MSLSREYVENVLNENFDDARRLFLAPLMSIQYAHLVMLAAQRIVTPEDARTLRQALDKVSLNQVRSAPFDPAREDLFCHVEQLIVDACGDETAGRLHTARSRNDIDMTMYRMHLRRLVLGLAGAALDLRGSLLELAGRHRETIIAAHTHTQRAQPTTVAHYLLAVVEQLERDAVRLKGAYERTNRSPLGACAITGTGFPIDRQMTAALLGFEAPTCNTYGSIATVDYLLEAVSAAAVLATGLGRFVQDLLQWGTSEVDYLRLGDGFVQTSTIMPQKRNPVALEHARAIASKALGQAQAVMTAVHNTPFGDIVDTEDDLQPLVASLFHDATRAVALVAAAMRTAEFDAAQLESRAAEGWTTLTELADTLVRDHGLPFRSAHAVASRMMTGRQRNPSRPLARLLAEASSAVRGAAIEYSEGALSEILSPRHFVVVRRTYGGPAPEETARASSDSRASLVADREWLDAAAARLAEAGRLLRERAEAL
jgi:argininosuccinate lyase